MESLTIKVYYIFNCPSYYQLRQLLGSLECFVMVKFYFNHKRWIFNKRNPTLIKNYNTKIRNNTCAAIALLHNHFLWLLLCTVLYSILAFYNWACPWFIYVKKGKHRKNALFLVTRNKSPWAYWPVLQTMKWNKQWSETALP